MEQNKDPLGTLDSKKNLLWEYFQHLDKRITPFNDLQSKYRQLGSSWLIFGLGAIGYLLKEINDSSNIEKNFLFIGLIGLILSLGMYIIFLFDIMLYQKMLDAIYIEKRALETSNPWLPQTSNNMRALLHGKGTKITVHFYLYSIGVSSSASSIGFILFFYYKTDYFYGLSIVGILITVILIVIGFILSRISKKTLSTIVYEQQSNFFNDRKKHYEELSL